MSTPPTAGIVARPPPGTTPSRNPGRAPAPSPVRPERVEPAPGPPRRGQDVRHLPPLLVGVDLGREVEIAVEQAPEVEPVEIGVEPEGERPVVGVRQVKVVAGPEVGDAPQGPEGRPATPARPPLPPGSSAPPQRGHDHAIPFATIVLRRRPFLRPAGS